MSLFKNIQRFFEKKLSLTSLIIEVDIDSYYDWYQENCRVYLDEYEGQDCLRENWFANRLDWIEIKGNDWSYRQKFNNTFLKRN